MELPIDRNGKRVFPGARVRVVELSGRWFDELLPDEKSDVSSMIGEIFEIVEIDEFGHPWVRKSWVGVADGTYREHWVALESQEMEIVDGDN